MLTLIRVSPELIIKSARVRGRFQKRLADNISLALAAEGIEHRVHAEWSRFEVWLGDNRGLEILQRVFGIQLIYVIEEQCPPQLDHIISTGLRCFNPQLGSGETFAVKARRLDKSLPFTSVDINTSLGKQLDGGRGLVQLSRPQRSFYIDVGTDCAYFYSQAVPGPGGLPLGSGGRALCLLSGGYDSAVAAWMVMKRGVELDFVLCNIAGSAFERSVVGIAKRLLDGWGHGGRARFYSVDFAPIIDNLRLCVAPNISQVLLKRLFYRAGNFIANQAGADALVTGEAIGQVSSQTLKNIRAIDTVAELPVLRPLIAYDKEEIIRLSRRIGTLDLCEKVQEFCQLVPNRPITACRPGLADAEEAKLNLLLLTDACVQAKCFDLADFSDQELRYDYLVVPSPPPGSQIIDIRSIDEYEAWHIDGARHIEFFQILRKFDQLEKSAVYTIYCAHGSMSLMVAEKMQQAGYLAYSLQGGLTAHVK